MTPPTVEIDGLQVVVVGTRNRVVDDVSLSLSEGEILGIVGESGSGKTTLSLSCLGHVRPGLRIVAGRVSVGGRDLLRRSPRQLRRERAGLVAYVPQDPSSALNPSRRIGIQLRESLSYGGRPAEVIQDRIRQVLAQASLDSSPKFLKRYPHQLSGGQRQRLTIAMAFLVDPSLIVMDEPTTGLDVSTQRHVLESVRTLAKSYGTSVIYVSHDISTVGVLADRAAVMYGGQVLEVGVTTQLLARPLHPYTRALLRAVPSLESASVLQDIPGAIQRPADRHTGCVFVPRCAFATSECATTTPQPVVRGTVQVRCLRVDELKPAGDPGRGAAPDPVRPNAGAKELTIHNLHASYGQKEILHGIDLSLASGNCLALVGESGSGKSTLARCIVGLHKNWSGEVQLGGTTLPQHARRRSLDELRAVHYVFQNPYMSLHPRKTVGETLDLTLRRFGVSDRPERSRRVETILEEVALSRHLSASFPDQLSGGEKQRVAIARALLAEPDVLVCDEVTSSLDVSVQAAIVNLLIRLQRERTLSLLFITHNLALVRSISQEVAILADGRIVEQGSPEEVLTRPKSAYAATLLSDTPRLVPVDQVAEASFERPVDFRSASPGPSGTS